MKPLCVILMLFGKKPAGDGREVDFDAVYEHLTRPAVIAAVVELIAHRPASADSCWTARPSRSLTKSISADDVEMKSALSPATIATTIGSIYFP